LDITLTQCMRTLKLHKVTVKPANTAPIVPRTGCNMGHKVIILPIVLPRKDKAPAKPTTPTIKPGFLSTKSANLAIRGTNSLAIVTTAGVSFSPNSNCNSSACCKSICS